MTVATAELANLPCICLTGASDGGLDRVRPHAGPDDDTPGVST